MYQRLLIPAVALIVVVLITLTPLRGVITSLPSWFFLLLTLLIPTYLLRLLKLSELDNPETSRAGTSLAVLMFSIAINGFVVRLLVLDWFSYSPSGWLGVALILISGVILSMGQYAFWESRLTRRVELN